MNKELYIKNEKAIEKERNLSCTVSILKEFLEDNEDNFKEVESIKSLQTIRNYLIKKVEELNEARKTSKEISKELYSTCNHEIAIQSRLCFGYACLVCNHLLTRERNDVPSKVLISIDTSNDYETEYIIKDTFEEIVHTDKDLIETISELVEDMKYDRNIKVYRR